MKTLLQKLHAKMGDLWWYSLMIFVASRSGDVIQAFIGLWLVPKYVGSNELGAVLPLQQLAGFFTVPLAIVATVFAKYVNTYATRGEYGKVKGFIRDVILISTGLFLVCIIVAYLLIPHFYERLNIAAGSLTLLILAAGFANNISALFSSALQGLKKFRTMTVQGLLAAPIRLITLLITMPFRPLSGYILGQATPGATCSVLAALSLRRDLKIHPLDTTWRKDLPEIGRYLWPIAIYMAFSTLFCTIQSTVFRQRLPEIESSAYYMLSRFSEVSGYVAMTLMVVLFPMASEAHEKGRENATILRRSIVGSLCVTIVLALLFAAFSHLLFSLNATWERYNAYSNLLPLMTLVTGYAAINGMVLSYEMACRRFGYCIVSTLFQFLWTAFLVSFTGYGFFIGILPDWAIRFMSSLHLANLNNMIYACLASALLQAVILCFFCQKVLFTGKRT